MINKTIAGRNRSDPHAPFARTEQSAICAFSQNQWIVETMQGHLGYPPSFKPKQAEDEDESSNPSDPEGQR